MTTPLMPSDVRYIKLGRGGLWEDISISRGEIHFGWDDIPHDLALTLDAAAIKASRLAAGRTPGNAAQETREVLDFYRMGSDCLWITFAQGYLWWAYAEPTVHWLGIAPTKHGSRMRKTLDGWRNTDSA